MLDNVLRGKVVSRLTRIEGQVAGIRRMVEDEACCVDLLNQISAVQAALAKVGGIVLENHMETCVAQAFSTRGESCGSAASLSRLRQEPLFVV